MGICSKAMYPKTSIFNCQGHFSNYFSRYAYKGIHPARSKENSNIEKSRTSEAKKRRAEANQPMAAESAESTTKAIGGHTGNTTEEDSNSSVRNRTWISWFCSLKRNEFFCEVDEAYINDSFNLYGLSKVVPYYEQALDLVTEFEYLDDVAYFGEEEDELVKPAAEMLYGLIHARYILTPAGMEAMRSKFRDVSFGTCPRVYCNGQHCLPVGQSDIPGSNEMRIYCPKCEEIYMSNQSNPDGAYFGTTFPHLFLMTYKDPKLVKASERYIPRVFGFKIHKPEGHN